MRQVSTLVVFRKLSLELQPVEGFNLPYSDGHLLYAALLEKVQDGNPDASKAMHDEKHGFSISCLDGPFGSVDTKPQKRVFDDGTYEINIGICGFNNDVVQSFDNATQRMLFSDELFPVGDGEFRVTGASVTETSVEELKQDADAVSHPEIEVNFESPACVRYGHDGAFEVFPHRMAVFGSLRERWNGIVDDKHRFDISNDTIGSLMFELSDSYSIDYHNVVVSKYKSDGADNPIKRQGFTGSCTYQVLDDASPAIKNCLVVLASAAEFMGVGASVARGCGSVETSVYNRAKQQ